MVAPLDASGLTPDSKAEIQHSLVKKLIEMARPKNYWDKSTITTTGERGRGVRYRAIQSLSVGSELSFKYGDTIVVTAKDGGYWTGYRERAGPEVTGRFSHKLVEPLPHQVPAACCCLRLRAAAR